MPKVLIVYFSNGGNTRKMAQALAQVIEEQGCEAEAKKVEETSLTDLRSADGILLGSACYFGAMAAPMKAFIDESVKLYGKGELEGKPGGAFCSTGVIGGGGELVNTSLINALLVHGMVVMGFRKGGHFGPLSIGAPDERVMEEIGRYGAKFAALVKKLAG